MGYLVGHDAGKVVLIEAPVDEVRTHSASARNRPGSVCPFTASPSESSTHRSITKSSTSAGKREHARTMTERVMVSAPK